MSHICSLIAMILLTPWVVFFFSWFITIGHWENEQYRMPALLLTTAIVTASALAVVLD
jgi:hypothetical protein